MIEQRTGQKILYAGSLGAVQVYQPKVAGSIWAAWFDHFWQAKGAATYAASKLDLVGSTNLSEGNGAVPWAAGTGWGLVAAFAQWLDTGLVPANDQSWSTMVQYANVANQGFLFGSRSGGGKEFQIEPNRGGNSVRYSNGFARQALPNLLTGNLAVAGNLGYRDGIVDPGGMAAWDGASLFSIYIGARDTLGVASGFIAAEIIALGIKKGPALTAPQVAAAAAAMAAL